MEALGAPEKWTSADLDKAKTLLKGLVVSELEKIDSTGLKNSLRNLKPVVWTMDQVLLMISPVALVELNIFDGIFNGFYIYCSYD